MGRTASSGVKLVHGHFFPLSIKTCHESTENIRCATHLENQIPHDEDIWLAFEESSHGLLDLSKKKMREIPSRIFGCCLSVGATGVVALQPYEEMKL
ncbi:MAG: hypothetical protein SO365_03090 [Prevotella sp.]|nr:hypothetical protein [Prevotella sp.]